MVKWALNKTKPSQQAVICGSILITTEYNQHNSTQYSSALHSFVYVLKRLQLTQMFGLLSRGYTKAKNKQSFIVRVAQKRNSRKYTTHFLTFL